jgi:hypothetical protein
VKQSRARALIVGAVVAVVYVGTLAAGVGWRSDGTRPLYDGLTPPPAYRWVDPPAFPVSDGEQRPTGVTTEVAMRASGSAAAGVTTPDGQVVINLPRGAIPPRRGARSARVEVTPVDPRELGEVPDELRPNGNAYRIDIDYLPGHRRVTDLARAGNLLLQVPELSTALFHSPQGARWAKVPAEEVPPREVVLTAPLAATGYYLSANNFPPLPQRSEDPGVPVLPVAAGITVVAGLVFGGGALVVRSRRRRAESGTAPTGAGT